MVHKSHPHLYQVKTRVVSLLFLSAPAILRHSCSTEPVGMITFSGERMTYHVP